MGYYLHSYHHDYDEAEYAADDLKRDTDTQNDVSVLELFNGTPGGFKFAVVEGMVPEMDDTEVQYVV